MKDDIVKGQRIRCYDDDRGYADSLTVIYMDMPDMYRHNVYSAVAMSGRPFHPQGVGQHCSAMPGRHLGKRIAFKDLPADCQKLVNQDLA